MSFFYWCLVYCRYQFASYDIKSNGFKEIYTHACKKHNLMRSKDIGYHIIQMYRSKKWARCTYNSTPNLTLDQWEIVTLDKYLLLKNSHPWKIFRAWVRNHGWNFFDGEFFIRKYMLSLKPLLLKNKQSIQDPIAVPGLCKVTKC